MGQVFIEAMDRHPDGREVLRWLANLDRIVGEILRKTGDFEGTRNDQRGMLMLRYEFGAPKSNFRSNKVSRMVTATERVPDPNWKPPVAAAASADAAKAAGTATKPQEPATRLESVSAAPTPATRRRPTLTSVPPSSNRRRWKELDGLVSRIAAQRPYVELKVNVVGHTCPTGSDRNNFALSKKRAEAVRHTSSPRACRRIWSRRMARQASRQYPEVKGQSFRNRRTDTDVLVVKEKVEEVRVPVAVSRAPAPQTPAAASAGTPTAAAATAPMIERQVQKK